MLYTDEKIVFDSTIVEANKLRIPTYLQSKSGKVSITYKLYHAKKGWKIYDVEIEGVSIIQSYRSQFDYILRSGTVNDLLMKLEEPEPADS